MSDKTFERNHALRPISRDHGVLLVLSQRLRKAAAGARQDRLALAKEVRQKFAGMIEEYLADENDSLSTLEFSELVRNEILSDHACIVTAVSELVGSHGAELTAGQFIAVADLIENHVRWDERVMLPYLQREIATSDWARLETKTSEFDRKHERPIEKLHRSIDLNKCSGNAETCTCSDAIGG